MTHKAVKIANLLIDRYINIGVIDLFILKPFKEELLFELLNKYDCVITLEEGFINKGGLDSLVSGVLDRQNSNLRLKRMGFEDAYVFDMGSREHLHKLNHLDEESIIKVIKDFLQEL
jgi:transketolase